MTINYLVTFVAGFTSQVNQSAKLVDLGSLEYSGVVADNGSTLDIMITSGNQAAAGYFCLLTENRMQIKKVSLVDMIITDLDDAEAEGEVTTTVTDLNLPGFDEPEIVWQGGKAFYLYTATGGAVTIPAGNTKMFRLKYKALAKACQLNQVGVFETLRGTADTPFNLKLNTEYHTDYTAFEKLVNGKMPFGHYNLPDNPHVGDEFVINLVSGGVDGHICEKPETHFVIYTASAVGKINGTVRTEDLRLEGSRIKGIYTGEESMGWVVYLATPRV